MRTFEQRYTAWIDRVLSPRDSEAFAADHGLLDMGFSVGLSRGERTLELEQTPLLLAPQRDGPPGSQHHILHPIHFLREHGDSLAVGAREP